MNKYLMIKTVDCLHDDDDYIQFKKIFKKKISKISDKFLY